MGTSRRSTWVHGARLHPLAEPVKLAKRALMRAVAGCRADADTACSRPMSRAIRVTGFVVTFVSALASVHGAGVPQIVPPNTPIVALTIDVSSAGAPIEVGQTRSVSGTVTLNTDQTRVVGSGSLWSLTFGPDIPVGNCGTGTPSFSSQVIQIDALGAFNNTWSPNAPNTLVGTGTFSMPLATAGATMAATLACGNNAATGSMAASWSGVHYTGTYGFNGVNGAIAVVGLTWSSSNTAVATVNPFGQVTAVSPGDAIITGTYGSTCWQMMPDAAGCVGTTVGTVSIHVDPGGGGGGGEEDCASLTLSLTADSAPVTSVDFMATVDGQTFGPFSFPIGQVITTGAGDYRLQFTPPDGHSVTPEQVQFTLACGDDRNVPLKFTDQSVPTIDTAIAQAEAMGVSTDLLKNAQARLLAGNVGASCNQIRAFMQYVAAQSGKSLSEADAAALLGTAEAIRTSLGCG